MKKKKEQEQASAGLTNAGESENNVTRVMAWLMPWMEKTNGEEVLGDWEQTLTETMMVKILELWLSEDNRQLLAKFMQFYHPLDRAGLAYALVVWVMTGHKMQFKSAAATHHYKLMQQALKADMAELAFAGHMSYMIRKYGPKKVKR